MKRRQKRVLQMAFLFTLALIFLPNVGLWSLYREKHLMKAHEGDEQSVHSSPDVFTDIFNISLSRAVVSTCSKTTTVPEKSSVSYLNDYRSIALTPIVMKCSERLIMRHTKTWLPPALNPMQDAYRHNCSTDNTIVTHMHEGCSYVDFSSTVQHNNSSASD
ncbi:hypothetical protein QTP86_000446 [Hemibagrus guttatus]|nr:hypothetical protein QTP86_000446 [Hemibagrus guttatus]